jgi:signal transduction histidine kinase
MKAFYSTSLTFRIVLAIILIVALATPCWFGICEAVMQWIDFSHGFGLVALIALVSITTTAVILTVVYRKILLPIKMIQQYNVGQITECTAEYCPIKLIPENNIPHDEIGELMRSRNAMLKRLQQVLGELKEQYEKIKRLEKLKDDLSHMIIHDLKNPLGTILLSAEMLQKENHHSETERKVILTVSKAAGDMKRMIENLLDIGKMEKDKLQLNPTVTQVGPFIETVLTHARESGMVENRIVTFLNDAPQSQISIDRELIQRVIVNLLSNAVKHTEHFGHITIRVEEIAHGQAMRISINDNGSGIAREYHEKIFEKFEQVNIKDQRAGSGLGLTFCKLAVEAHHGRIWVESEMGKGSTFFIELPLDVSVEHDNSVSLLTVDTQKN